MVFVNVYQIEKLNEEFLTFLFNSACVFVSVYVERLAPCSDVTDGNL